MTSSTPRGSRSAPSWEESLTASQRNRKKAAEKEEFVISPLSDYKQQYPKFNPNNHLDEASQWKDMAVEAYNNGSSFNEVSQLIAYFYKINIDRREMAEYLKRHGDVASRTGSKGKGLPFILAYSDQGVTKKKLKETRQALLASGWSSRDADNNIRVIAANSKPIDVRVHTDDKTFSNPKVLRALCETYNLFHQQGSEVSGTRFEDLLVKALNQAGIPAEKTPIGTRGADVKILLEGQTVILEMKTLTDKNQKSGNKLAIESLHRNPLGVPQDIDTLKTILSNLRDQLSQSDRLLAQQLDKNGINTRTGRSCYRYNLIEIPLQDINKVLDQIINGNEVDDELNEYLYLPRDEEDAGASLTLEMWTENGADDYMKPEFKVHIGKDSVALTAIQPHFTKPLATFSAEPAE